MRRDAFLKLTGLSTSNLKNLVRRGALPYAFTDAEVDGDTEEGSNWRDYSERTVLETVLALRLADAGLSQPEAATFVVRGSQIRSIAQGMAALDEKRRDADIWCGAAKMHWQSGNSAMTGLFPVAGPIDALMGMTSAGEKFDLAEFAAQASSLVIVNLSQLRRDLDSAARLFGIDANFKSGQ